jgi:hypothetical protein
MLLLFPALSFAWIDTGHEIIASIAYDELTPAARGAANALLKHHPRYEQDLQAGCPDGFDHDRYAFMKAATWPDMVKSMTHPMRFVANHPGWHYIDLPIAAAGYPAPATQPAAATQPDEPRNILEAMDKVVADIGNEKLPATDRAIALCWILHLCGDLHQPLHVATFYSAQYPDGDKGGNMAMVKRPPTQFNAHVSLHALWDEMLGMYEDPEMIGYVAAGLRSNPPYSRDRLAGELREQSFADWAKETHALAITSCYLNGQLATASESSNRVDRQANVPALPADYLENGEKVAARQAVLAGYRTADLLHRLFIAK